jgi:hypothetical protein
METFPKDCKIQLIESILSETRKITIIGLSVQIVIFELDYGFQIRSDEDLGSDNTLPWYSIEELREILNWLAQFREPMSGNEELDFEKLWQVAQQSINQAA